MDIVSSVFSPCSNVLGTPICWILIIQLLKAALRLWGPGDFRTFKIFVMRPDGKGLMRLTSEQGGLYQSLLVSECAAHCICFKPGCRREFRYLYF